MSLQSAIDVNLQLVPPALYSPAEPQKTGISVPGVASGPIIAAVTSMEAFEQALDSPTQTLYLLTGNPLTLPRLLERGTECGKTCVVNMDFLEGLARDRAAVEFLAKNGATGIVSTRFETLKMAQSLGLLTVQRTFALDFSAINTAKKSLSQFRPDAVEVLPAVAAPRVRNLLLERCPDLPVIGSGLVQSVREMEDLLAAGVHAVTTSDPRLWII